MPFFDLDVVYFVLRSLFPIGGLTMYCCLSPDGHASVGDMLAVIYACRDIAGQVCSPPPPPPLSLSLSLSLS